MSRQVVKPRTTGGRKVSWWVQDADTMHMVATNNRKLAAEKERVAKQRADFERMCQENP